MIAVNVPLQLVLPIVRRCNLLKHCNKAVLRGLSSQQIVVPSVLLCPGRSSAKQSTTAAQEWAPNVVRSPAPDISVPDTLFTDLFWSKNDHWAHLPAIVCGVTGREMSYRDLRKACGRFAVSLLRCGFRPGQVVALVLPNTPEIAVVSLGAIEAGLVISTINPAYTPDEIAFQLKDSTAVGVITLPEKLEEVLAAKRLAEKPGLRVICAPDKEGREPERLPEDVEPLSALLGEAVDEGGLTRLLEEAGPPRRPEDLVFIPYSSGTTGVPKGVCLTHRNLVSCLTAMQVMRDVQEPAGGVQDVVPFILPGFHIYGFTVIMCQALFYGGKLVTLPKFEEDSFLRVLKDYKATVLYVAPPLVIYMGSSDRVTRDHLTSLRIILSGAAPVGESDILKCVKKSPSTVFYKQGYGMTETSPAICCNLEFKKKYSSVGPPVVNTQVKVADLQTGQALGPMEEGEICVKGPQVMKGYLNQEKATQEVFDSEGWFRTGDIGYYDEERCFYITDRLKELIKVKGFQVAPAELEAILRTHPDVMDSGVIGVPDQIKGETPVGFVQLRPGAKTVAAQLKDFLKGKVAKFKMIDTFVFVESIPKSASGKILRKKLKEDFLKNQQS